MNNITADHSHAQDQRRDVDFDPTKFDGVWRLSRGESSILDPDSGKLVDEVLTDQWVERRTTGDVLDYKMHVQIKPNLTTHMEYTVKINDSEWAPYAVVGIDGDPNDPVLLPGDDKLLKWGTIVGRPIAWVKILYVDPWTQVRLSKNIDGTTQYVMKSRLSEDGNQLFGYVLTPAGQLIIDKHFVRESD